MIRVTFDGDLPERSKTGQSRFESEIEAGTTIAKFLKGEGFGPSERTAMLAAINGEHVDMDTELADGNSLLVTMAIQGGSIYRRATA